MSENAQESQQAENHDDPDYAEHDPARDGKIGEIWLCHIWKWSNQTAVQGKQLDTRQESLYHWAMANKKKSGKPADAGFLTTTAQAIGSTLGQIAKKAGVAGSPARKKAVAKSRVVKKTAPKKKVRTKSST